MKACVWISAIAACAVFLAGNALAADVEVHLRIGEILNTRVETFPYTEEEITCYLDPPTGDTLTFIRDQQNALYQEHDPDKFTLLPFSPLSSCAVNVVITDPEDEGVWRLHFKTTSGSSGDRSFKVILDTPGNPDSIAMPNEDVNRTIEHLNGMNFNTEIGKSHEVRISYVDFVTTESCHIVTPNEKTYNLNDTDSISALGIKVLKNSNTACGVKITVQSEKSVGKWTLFSKATRFSDPIERRLDFTINVEESVEAMPEDVTITEGSDLYVRLRHPTTHYETCRLYGPNGKTDTPHKIDETHRYACGFIVPNVTMNYAGRWEIVYGDTIKYRAVIFVTTNVPWDGAVTQLEWLKDRPVHMEVGPDNAVYCSITAPEEIDVFESFGRCTIILDRATEQHSGTWSMVVGTPGRVLTEHHTFTVHVRGPAPRPQVITRVESLEPAVLLTCAIPGDNSIRSCKFKDPSGRVLMAPRGVGEDRYSFHGAGVSLESNVTKSDCGLRITNPVAEELGMWRCSVVTYEDRVHHGFLRVLLPWVTADMDIVSTEPTLTATHDQVAAVEGDAVIMSCSIQSEIKYCYFRAQNGTIFSVSPSTESDVIQYVGAGFDAGECGIRFSHLQERDSGPWSCHVGFTSPTEDEKRANFRVNIQRAIIASQRPDPRGLVVEGWVHDERELEYCRYVRIDGLGFGSFSANLPDRVIAQDNLQKGHCSILIEHPISPRERDHWTVVAKIAGQEVEVYASTDPGADKPHPPPPPPPPPPPIIIVRRSYLWLVFFLLGISLMVMALSMVSKSNRRWVQQRATTFGQSFRKQTVPPTVLRHNGTTMAA